MLGAAQIDRWGNLNTTVIGPYERPGRPAAGVRRSVRDRPQRPARGRRHEPVHRARSSSASTSSPRPATVARTAAARVRRGPAPGRRAVVTQLGVYHFGPDGEMELAGLHAGVDEETVDAGTGWPMRRAASVLRLAAPSDEALVAIRALVA